MVSKASSAVPPKGPKGKGMSGLTKFILGGNLIVALGVAITKATLVVLYFMHARYSPKLTGVVIASSIAFFVILVFLTLTDYVSRPWPLTAAG